MVVEAGATVENNSADAGASVDNGNASVSVGTPDAQTGQAIEQDKGAPGEESFSDVDPKTLSPENQAVYKQMQAAFTKKTQALADVRKKAEYYDQLVADQRVVEFVRQMNNPKPAETKQQEAVRKSLAEMITPEEFQQAFTSQEKFLSLLERVANHSVEPLKKENEGLKAQMSVKDAGEVVQAFASQTDKLGNPLRPDFDALEEDGLITGYLTINGPKGNSEKNYLQALNDAYAWSKMMTQKYYEKGRQDALSRIQQKAATSTEMPTNAAKGVYSGPDPKKLTAGEALQLAKKGIRVPRDD